MKIQILACASLGIAALLPGAEVYTTEPLGFNKVTCLTSSDTIVGVPLRHSGSIRTLIAAPPVVNGDSVTLTLLVDTLEPGALGKHYLKFLDGDRAGRWYDIETTANQGTPNTSSTVTIYLNGDTIGNTTAGDAVMIVEHWTLDSLFPPAGATTGWSGDPLQQNGHAIVSSLGTAPSGRRTQILLPNNLTMGTNRPSTDIFYINRNTYSWVKVGGSTTPPGATIIYPDTSITIRHASTVSNPTVFRGVGEVVTTNQVIVLSTRPLGSGNHDNYVAIPRPVNVSLWDLNIVQSGNFTPSSGTSPAARRDQLLVYNNELAMINKPADAIYYYLVDKWVRAGDPTLESRNDTLIPAGAGVIVRKYNTAGGVSSFWLNNPTY